MVEQAVPIWNSGLTKSEVRDIEKMPQRRDNAGAVYDSGMGMLFLNQQFLSYRRLLYQKMW